MMFYELLHNLIEINLNSQKYLKDTDDIQIPNIKNKITIQEKNFIKYLLNNNITSEKSNMFFIYQPNGTQQSPDFHIFINNVLFEVELKSSKNNKIMLNDHIIINHYIYIISCNNYNTIVCLGKHMISSSDIDILKNIKLKTDELNIIYRELSKNTSIYPTIRCANTFNILSINVTYNLEKLKEEINGKITLDTSLIKNIYSTNKDNKCNGITLKNTRCSRNAIKNKFTKDLLPSCTQHEYKNN